jgi:hypothetical protein
VRLMCTRRHWPSGGAKDCPFRTDQAVMHASVLGGLTIRNASGGVIPVTVAVAAAPFLSPGETGQRLYNLTLHARRTNSHRTVTPAFPSRKIPDLDTRYIVAR